MSWLYEYYLWFKIDWLEQCLASFNHQKNQLIFYKKFNETIHRQVPLSKYLASIYPLWVSKALKELLFTIKQVHKLYTISHGANGYNDSVCAVNLSSDVYVKIIHNLSIQN